MVNQQVIEGLRQLLSDSYALYLKTQNYHWNVTGPRFHMLHEMFEEQYKDLAEAIDEIAERIRILGEKAPGRWSVYSDLTTIQEGDEHATEELMVADLAEDQSKILTTLSNLLEASQEAGDEVTIGMVVDRMSIHEKTAWMLRSSL